MWYCSFNALELSDVPTSTSINLEQLNRVVNKVRAKVDIARAAADDVDGDGVWTSDQGSWVLVKGTSEPKEVGTGWVELTWWDGVVICCKQSNEFIDVKEEEKE